jgi:hypothetical protein
MREAEIFIAGGMRLKFAEGDVYRQYGRGIGQVSPDAVLTDEALRFGQDAELEGLRFQQGSRRRVRVRRLDVALLA